MKLKTIILATAAAGSLIAASSSFAATGFELKNNVVVGGATKVVCTPGGASGSVNYRVPWKSLRNLFLAGKYTSTCKFYNPFTGAELGQGSIQIKSDDSEGTLSKATAATGYTVDINGTSVTKDKPQTTPITSDTVTVSISKS